MSLFESWKLNFEDAIRSKNPMRYQTGAQDFLNKATELFDKAEYDALQEFLKQGSKYVYDKLSHQREEVLNHNLWRIRGYIEALRSCTDMNGARKMILDSYQKNYCDVSWKIAFPALLRTDGWVTNEELGEILGLGAVETRVMVCPLLDCKAIISAYIDGSSHYRVTQIAKELENNGLLRNGGVTI